MSPKKYQRAATMIEFVAALLVLMLLWAAAATVMEMLSEHNDEYTDSMSSPYTSIGCITATLLDKK